MVAGQTETGDAPACDIAEAKSAARIDDASKGRAAGVGCAENAAHTGSRDVRNGNLVLLEDLQNAQMGKASRKSSTESESYPWPRGRRGWTLVQCLLRRMRLPDHRQRMTGAEFFIYGPAVLEKQYDCTAMETERDFAQKK